MHATCNVIVARGQTTPKLSGKSSESEEANFKAIDAVCNLRIPEIVARRRHQWVLFGTSFAKEEPLLSTEDMIQTMNRAGIEKAFLIAARLGSRYQGFMNSIPYDDIEAVANKHPDRFFGLAGIDPLEGMEGVRALEDAVKGRGFIGAHL